MDLKHKPILLMNWALDKAKKHSAMRRHKMNVLKHIPEEPQKMAAEKNNLTPPHFHSMI